MALKIHLNSFASAMTSIFDIFLIDDKVLLYLYFKFNFYSNHVLAFYFVTYNYLEKLKLQNNSTTKSG